ncbi:hypothetical protein P5673_000652 [Acropora cervicornis]|uniref:Secreted protein n=1 Tax=Acropora cervicornis TaxID=6130 RepID=A0AAD9R7K9_ACRCE|nr:hypothetical protein P5673_000652 [Acropora cervicornis]
MNMAYHPSCFFLALIVQVFFILAFMEQSITATARILSSKPTYYSTNENCVILCYADARWNNVIMFKIVRYLRTIKP